jgi:GT2 family glycosyltransferase
MDAAPAAAPAAEAPPVVAVVVTCDPGWWLEPCLLALGDQDYPQLAVLVIDAGSEEDPTARIAEVAPGAFVRRVRRRRGFGAAANEVLDTVEGAAYYLMCHDDVAPAPGAVRHLVEEALRSNAGIIAPKLVEWAAPDRLLATGMGADRFGISVPLVERGELDQQQHDAVRDVFFAPAACALVRADLLATLKGFDVGLGVVGEDLDLGWRAHVAGARVVFAPGARVRHLEATDSGRRALGGGLRDQGPAVAVAVADAPGLLAPTPDDDWELPAWDEDDGTDRATRSPLRRRRHEAQHELDDDADAWNDWASAERIGRRGAASSPSGATLGVGVPLRSPDADALDRLRGGARLRALACDYGALRAGLRLTVLLVLALGHAAVTSVRVGAGPARRELEPWRALAHEGRAIRKRRRAVHEARAVPDAAVVALQAHGAARLAVAWREGHGTPPAATEGWLSRRRPGAALAAWAAILVVLFGTRHLVFGHFPVVGELGRWPSLGTLSRYATSGWRTTGLGASTAAPTAFGLLSLGGAVALGHMTFLQHVLVLGMVPLGALGVWLLSRPLGSGRVRVAALVAYVAVPLPYNAIAEGRWSGLVGYAVLPWLLGVLARWTGLPPFPRAEGWQKVVGAALLLAAAGAVEPALVPLAVLVGVALLAGAALTREFSAGARALRLVALAGAGSLVLLAPWSVGWLPPVGEWATFSRPAAHGGAAHLSTLLRFQTGPLGAGLLGYALLVVAAFPLLVGRDWRAAWAVRMWVIALASFALAWAGQHGALGLGWPPPDVLLAPAAAAVAVSAALGVAAFEVDLPGYHFGWRQVASVVAGLAACLACVPVLARSVDGRWRQPSTGYDALLQPWMAAKQAQGDFRVLWVGAPTALPLAGWRLDGRTAYATSIDGVPGLTDQWPATSRGPTRLLGQALVLARRGLTAEAGHLLAPMGVRYIVLASAPAPLATAGLKPVPGDLAEGLASQLDLEVVDRSLAMTVYQNDAWMPMRAQLPDGTVAAAQLDDPRVAGLVDLSASSPVLPQEVPATTARGALGAAAAIEVASAPSGHWQLSVGGESAARQPAFGSANLFTVRGAGGATLRYNTPIGWRLALAAQACAWAVALAVVLAARRRRVAAPDEEQAVPAAPAVLVGTLT